MISPIFTEQFKHDASCNAHLMGKIRDYISSRYETCNDKPVSVYSVCVGFQMKLGAIPQSALAYWMNEWGYHVIPSKGQHDRNHSVFVRLKKEFS
jgi:hypothetical protein